MPQNGVYQERQDYEVKRYVSSTIKNKGYSIIGKYINLAKITDFF
jgi:hypothetical protein